MSAQGLLAVVLPQVVTAAAVAVAGLALLVGRRVLPAIGVLLDLLLAAGLLRLSVSASWEALATAALVATLRHVLVPAIRTAQRTAGHGEGPGPQGVRALR